jgi:hypothetical protein
MGGDIGMLQGEHGEHRGGRLLLVKISERWDETHGATGEHAYFRNGGGDSGTAEDAPERPVNAPTYKEKPRGTGWLVGATGRHGGNGTSRAFRSALRIYEPSLR